MPIDDEQQDPQGDDAPGAADETLTVQDVLESGPVEPVASEHLVAVLEALVARFAAQEEQEQEERNRE